MLVLSTWLGKGNHPILEKREKNASFKRNANNFTNNVGEKACWECGKPGHQKKNSFDFKNKLKKAKGGQVM